MNELRQQPELIEPPLLPQPVCRNPDDDHALTLALAAGADLIVYGDEDLLALGRFQGMPIVARRRRCRESPDKRRAAASGPSIFSNYPPKAGEEGFQSLISSMSGGRRSGNCL